MPLNYQSTQTQAERFYFESFVRDRIGRRWISRRPKYNSYWVYKGHFMFRVRYPVGEGTRNFNEICDWLKENLTDKIWVTEIDNNNHIVFKSENDFTAFKLWY